MTNRRKTNYAQFDKFQEAIAQGRPNDWRCRAGSRYLYICEDGLVHYCSQQRGYPGIPISEYTTAHVKREFLTAKSCAPNCTIGCVHRISHIDHWRAPQTKRFLRAPRANWCKFKWVISLLAANNNAASLMDAALLFVWG